MSLPVAQLDGPGALVALSGPTQAALSFVFVLAVGALLASQRGPTVDRAIDRTLDGSPAAVVYGVMAFALVVFLGGYLVTQVSRVGGEAGRLGGTLVVGAAVLALAGYGYLVVGAYLTEIEGERRVFHGAVVGAALSAVPWLLLSTPFAVGVWLLVAAVGLGSPTRHWIHGARTVESEARR